jgi:proline utilization trans-activator
MRDHCRYLTARCMKILDDLSLKQCFYCYSLNRRKTAFIYSGLSMRLSNMIGLDKPAGPAFSALQREHRKRLWWTSYCLDKNTSTEMGWKPAYTLADRELNYPSNEQLSQDDLEEFHDPDFLTAQVKLTKLKLSITETAYRLKSGNLVDNHEIRSCLDMLQKWESDLTPNVASNIASGISREMSKSRTTRTTSSLFLKCNHVSVLYFFLCSRLP